MFIVFHQILQIELTENGALRKPQLTNRSDPDYVIIDSEC